MKFTLIPVSFVNSAKTFDAYFSGMIVYALSVAAIAPVQRTSTKVRAVKTPKALRCLNISGPLLKKFIARYIGLPRTFISL